MNRAGRWIVAALAGAVAWAPSGAEVRRPVTFEDGVASLQPTAPLHPAAPGHLSAAPATPFTAGSAGDREGPGTVPGDDPHAPGSGAAGSLPTRPLPGPRPSTSVSPAVASRAAAARSGLLSSGRRAPPSRTA